MFCAFDPATDKETPLLFLIAKSVHQIGRDSHFRSIPLGFHAEIHEMDSSCRNLQLLSNVSRFPTLPVKLDDETQKLWDSLLAAKDDDEDLFDLSCDARRLAGWFEGREFHFRRPVSEELQALIQRARDLADAFMAHEHELKGRYESLSWRFTAHAFELRPGDRISYRNWKQQEEAISVDRLSIGDSDIGDITVGGRILKKDGTPGKREFWIPLLRTKWSKLP